MSAWMTDPISTSPAPSGIRSPTASTDLAPTPGPAPWTVPTFMAPILVILAATAVMEGYIWLDVIRVQQWRPVAVALAAVTFTAVMLLNRSRPGRESRAVKVLTVAAGILLVATVVAVAVDRQPFTCLAGVVNLLLALITLSVVVTSERLARRRP